jgi:hypothetical protein
MQNYFTFKLYFFKDLTQKENIMLQYIIKAY